MVAIRLFTPMIWPWKRDESAREPQAVEPSAAELLGPLIAALPDPVLILNRTGEVMAANEHVSDIFDFDPRGQHLSASIRAPAVLEALGAVLGGGEVRRVEYLLPSPFARHFDVYLSPVKGAPAQGPAALIVLKDLTREQQIERMRADFVANASHELRTPLAALSGFIETLMGAARYDDAARDRFLGLMRSQAERMKRLIGDLLSLSRIEMNVHIRPSAQVDLVAVAAQAADAMADLAKDTHCELRLRLEGELYVAGDREELVQVMQNLIENAIRYAGEGRPVDIAGRIHGSFAELSVRDYGAGIAAEHLPRLTERFYRVSVQESRSRGGTGLGLAIVKHILNRHRGRLVISSSLGEGSIFTVIIPHLALSQ